MGLTYFDHEVRSINQMEIEICERSYDKISKRGSLFHLVHFLLFSPPQERERERDFDKQEEEELRGRSKGKGF
jgi:hypothetical protein